MKISKSPHRHTFQKEKYMERKSKDKTLSTEKIEEIDEMESVFVQIEQQHEQRFDNPENRKHNLEYDLLTTDWILEKARKCETYSQNLYAAMCNNEFTKKEMWPILKEQKWSCSWRYAGGIIADMRQEGDYIDWYCSGIRNSGDDGESIDTEYVQRKYVSESVVTDEIQEDLDRLGWIIVKYNGEDDVI